MQDKKTFTKSTFDTLFREYYQDLCRFAYSFLRDESRSDDCVQEVFILIWEKRKSLPDVQSWKSYLFRAVRNKSIDLLRKDMRYSISSIDDHNVSELSYYDYSHDGMYHKDLKNGIEDSINNLPERCRNIFLLSREAKLTYVEIAKELGVSRKTVENQIGIALKKIRAHLVEAEFISFLIIVTYVFNSSF